MKTPTAGAVPSGAAFFVFFDVRIHPRNCSGEDGGAHMETVLQLVVASGIALSLYGFVQLATRTPTREEKLAPFWFSLIKSFFFEKCRLIPGEDSVPLLIQ